ncbi:hypothetical protein APY03_6235 [Variovorax sp. WDL1]|nr:hypothetical protein APY03_6235 [Variovorax sp. WDL1]
MGGEETHAPDDTQAPCTPRRLVPKCRVRRPARRGRGCRAASPCPTVPASMHGLKTFLPTMETP